MVMLFRMTDLFDFFLSLILKILFTKFKWIKICPLILLCRSFFNWISFIKLKRIKCCPTPNNLPSASSVSLAAQRHPELLFRWVLELARYLFLIASCHLSRAFETSYVENSKYWKKSRKIWKKSVLGLSLFFKLWKIIYIYKLIS